MRVKSGLNLDWKNAGGRPEPGTLGEFEWVRLVARLPWETPDSGTGETFAGYVAALKADGRKVIVVLASQSFSDVGQIVPETVQYAQLLDADCWEIGNEPDAGYNPGNSDFDNSAPVRRANHLDSWVMDPPDYANLVYNCAHYIGEARPDATIVTAGLSSGFPEWLLQCGPLPISGIAVHPYVKRPRPDWPPDPQWEYVGTLLDKYWRTFHKELWVTEYGWNAGNAADHDDYYVSMLNTLEARDDVRLACAYCFSNAMNPGYGIVDTLAWSEIQGQPGLIAGDGPRGPLRRARLGAPPRDRAHLNKALVRRFAQEIYNDGKLEAADELAAASYRFSDGHGRTTRRVGLDGLRQRVEGLRAAFSDYRIDLSDLVAEGDGVTARFRVRATGAADVWARSARADSLSYAGVVAYRVRDGKIAEERVVWDPLSLLYGAASRQAGGPPRRSVASPEYRFDRAARVPGTIES